VATVPTAPGPAVSMASPTDPRPDDDADVERGDRERDGGLALVAGEGIYAALRRQGRISTI